jgi:hypothetical protein
MDIEKISELQNITTIVDGDELVVESTSDGSIYRIKISDIQNFIDPLIPSDGLRGVQGDKGQKGPPGGQGGNPGSKGEPGLKGAIGNKGKKGYEGIKGIPGEPGESTLAGGSLPTGDKGSIGPNGPKGYKGATGQRGSRGPVGDQPTHGPKGYNGIRGRNGVIGVKGEQGDPGDTYGSNHPIRKTKPGQKGEPGSPATGGLSGDVGIKGFKGNMGRPGRRGARGQTGTRENKVNYPLYGAKLKRDWEVIWNDALVVSNHSGLDYISKKDYLTSDYSQLKYKFIKILFKINPNYFPQNIVQSNSLFTCILMIPGKLTKWSPVMLGSPPMVWYKESADTQNDKNSRNLQRQGVQIFIDTDNFSSHESVWPDQKIKFTIQEPNASFGLGLSNIDDKLKIMAVYGSNDI